MALAVRAVANGTTTAVITPAVNDVFYVFVSYQAPTTPTTTPTAPTDDNGGSYSLVKAVLYGGSTGVSGSGIAALFVRTAKLANTTSTTITPAALGGNSFTNVLAISGLNLAGTAGVVQSAGQTNGAAAGTPTVTFGATTGTGNMTIGAVINQGNPATMTPPTSWTEQQDTHNVETISRVSGFVGTTVTWGSTSATNFGALMAELSGTTTWSETAAIGLTAALAIAASHATYPRTPALSMTAATAVAAAHSTLRPSAPLAMTVATAVAASHSTLRRSPALSMVQALAVAASHSTLRPRPALSLVVAPALLATHATLRPRPALSLVVAPTVLFSVAFQPGPKQSWYYTWYGPRGYVFTDGWWGVTPDGNVNKAVGRLVSLLLAPSTYSSGLGGDTYKSGLVALDTLLSNLGD